MGLPDELRSRKLAGLLIVLSAMILLFVAYIVASIWVNVSEAVVSAMSTAIASLGLGHQGAQAAQDRAQALSPNYPTPPRPEPRPGAPVAE